MTKNKLNRILIRAEIYYNAFPVEVETSNHSIIKRSISTIKRILEYKGVTRGAGALPKELLEIRYNEMYSLLQKSREQADRTQRAYKEAMASIEDADELLDYIFL